MVDIKSKFGTQDARASRRILYFRKELNLCYADLKSKMGIKEVCKGIGVLQIYEKYATLAPVQNCQVGIK